MTSLRVGTRGSDLALTQTKWVIARLRKAHPSLTIKTVVIKTHGDMAVDQRFDADWPVGGFVGAIEQALMRNEIDFAVHSYKDLQTAVTAGLIVAAIPPREIVHDVLVSREAVDLNAIPRGFRIGTSSPRRAAQWRRWADVEIVPLRGNVPTRLKKVETDEMDGVTLAAAGLKRLGLKPRHMAELPVERFVPSPAQGALAIQTRESDPAQEIVSVLDDSPTRQCVAAERSFLRAINAGCHVPVGALAAVSDCWVTLHGQLFSEDGERLVESLVVGTDPPAVGESLARRLLAELQGG